MLKHTVRISPLSRIKRAPGEFELPCHWDLIPNKIYCRSEDWINSTRRKRTVERDNIPRKVQNICFFLPLTFYLCVGVFICVCEGLRSCTGCYYKGILEKRVNKKYEIRSCFAKEHSVDYSYLNTFQNVVLKYTNIPT